MYFVISASRLMKASEVRSYVLSCVMTQRCYLRWNSQSNKSGTKENGQCANTSHRSINQPLT